MQGSWINMEVGPDAEGVGVTLCGVECAGRVADRDSSGKPHGKHSTSLLKSAPLHTLGTKTRHQNRLA